MTIWHATRTDNRYTFYNGRPLVFDAEDRFTKADLEDLKADGNFSVEGFDKDFEEYNTPFEAMVKLRSESRAKKMGTVVKAEAKPTGK